MFHSVESSLSLPFDKVSKLFRELCWSSVLETNLNMLCLVLFLFLLLLLLLLLLFFVILVWVSWWFVCLDLSFWPGLDQVVAGVGSVVMDLLALCVQTRKTSIEKEKVYSLSEESIKSNSTQHFHWECVLGERGEAECLICFGFCF